MKVKKNLLLIMLTIIIITQFLSVIQIAAQPVPIGDPSFNQKDGYDSNPTDGSLIGAPTGGFTPTTADAPNARDGDTTGTNVNWRIGAGAQNVIIAVQQNSFETTPPGGPFTIGWVDIKVAYRSTATTNDQYRIVYTTVASPAAGDWIELQTWISGANAKFTHDGTTDQRAWSNKLPNDGTWDWTDIGNLKVRAETRKTDTVEDATTNRFYLYEVWATIYKGTYPSAGPGVSMQPPVIQDLHAGDSFYVDVFVTDVVTMHGFGFVIRYNPYVLSALDYFDYNPFYTTSPSEYSEWTYLYVKYFDNARAGWSPSVGTSPYLSKADYPDNYINTTVDGDTIGDFYFSNITSPNYGHTVNIELMAAGDGDDQVELWLNDGTVGGLWHLVDTVTPPAGPLDPLSTPWTTSIDVGGILDTQAKINTAKVYLVKKTVGTEGEMDVDSMRLSVASGYVSVSYSSWMADPVGFTGSGPVVRVYFQADIDGSSLLHFDKAILSTVLGDRIVPNYVYDGVFATTPVHDVAVTDVKVNETQTMPGGGVEVNVTVANQGTDFEDFTVTAFYNLTQIGTPKPVTHMTPSTTQVVTFDWDTTGVDISHYLIKAEATLASDANPSDNTKPDGIVVVGRHDIAVTNVTRIYYNATLSQNVTLPKTELLTVEAGTIVFINVTVTNLGNFPETFSINATYSGGGAETPKITKTWLDLTLDSGTSWTDTFAWNTSVINFYVGGYTGWLKSTQCTHIAQVTTDIPYEKTVDETNNVFTDGIVNVTRPRRPIPVIDITTSNETRVAGKPLDFSAAHTQTAEGTKLTSLEWDFGDGTKIVYQRPENLTTPFTAVLRTPGSKDKYLDRDNDDVWDVGEPAIRDNDDSGTLSTGDSILAGTVIQGDIGKALKAPGSKDKYWDQGKPYNEWNRESPAEPAIRDNDDSGNYTVGDVVLAGTAPPLETYMYETHHAYATAGTFTVTLKATNNETLSGTVTESLYVGSIDLAITNVIRVYPKGVAIPADTLLKVKRGEMVYLNVTVWNYDTLSRTESFNITVYRDDTAIDWLRAGHTGSVNNGTSRTFEFSWNTSGVAAGTYTVKAVLNPIESLTKTYEINKTNNEFTDGLVKVSIVPVASFSYMPSKPLKDMPVIFDASGSHDDDGDIVKYEWDFNDDSKLVYVGTNLTALATHTFAAKAVYTVNLTVTDNDGFIHTTSQDVTVYVRDVAVTGVSVSQTEVVAGESLTITVDVANQGDFNENVTLTVLYDDVDFDVQEFDLEKGSSTSVPVAWYTEDVSPGNYTIKAEVSIAVDNDLTDNTMLGGEQVMVKAGATSLWIYAVAGVAIVIVIAGVSVYLLKFRKRKT